jgi:hypothetical protein
MKIKSLLSLSLISVLAIFSTVFLTQKPIFSQSADKIQFNCANTLEIDSGEKMPTTVVWIPEEKKNVPMIYWKSQAFGKWSPDARCNTVSPKFDQAFREGRLNYITDGKVSNANVLCAIAKEGEVCKGENQLFTINPYQDPSTVLKQMTGFFQGESGAIYQSGGKTYIKIDLEKLAKQKGVEIVK